PSGARRCCSAAAAWRWRSTPPSGGWRWRRWCRRCASGTWTGTWCWSNWRGTSTRCRRWRTAPTAAGWRRPGWTAPSGCGTPKRGRWPAGSTSTPRSRPWPSLRTAGTSTPATLTAVAISWKSAVSGGCEGPPPASPGPPLMNDGNASQTAAAPGGPDPQAAAPDLSGRVLKDFRLLRRLGQGGMGQVWLAEQISLKRKVALKILRADLAADRTALQRLKAEAEAVARDPDA